MGGSSSKNPAPPAPVACEDEIPEWLKCKAKKLISLVQRRVLDTQRTMALRQRETMMAMELAKARDRFQWFCGFYATVMIAGGIASFTKRNPAFFIAPQIPLNWLLAFQYDLAYGNKLERVVQEADRILLFEWHKFRLPYGALLMENPGDYDKLLIEDRLKRNQLILSQNKELLKKRFENKSE